jgi:glycosyltransferase involved in cell wall biosynthesis
MRILFVALPQNEHAVRHINAIANQGWDIHVFPAYDTEVLPHFKNITAYHRVGTAIDSFDPTIRIKGLFRDASQEASYTRSRQQYADATKWFPRLPGVLRRVRPTLNQYLSTEWTERANWLARVIAETKPDIIHSHTMFGGGYLTLKARDIFVRNNPSHPFPVWIASNWGMDIHFLGQIGFYRDAYITRILQLCDYYACECERDIDLAQALGLKGKPLPVIPIGGGYDIQRVRQLQQPGLVSERRVIALKGYQNLVGRALVAMHALELCIDLLKEYKVKIYLLPSEYEPLPMYLTEKLGIPVENVGRQKDHEAILKIHGSARISIGLSISDAISTSLLEAMIMGAFPIQSNTACADEWVQDGKSALLVPPEDPYAVAEAIKRALLDDDLVNRAAQLNAEKVTDSLDNTVIQPKIVQMYKQIATECSLA